MKSVNVMTVALNQTPLDWAGNEKRIFDALKHIEGAQFVCFQEMVTTGYGCEDWYHSPATSQRALRMAQRIAESPLSRGRVIFIGLPVWYQNAVYNGVAVLKGGTIAGITAKQNLANDGVHYEARWFKPWTPGVVRQFSAEGLSCPIGDLVYTVQGIRFKIEVCQDGWVSSPVTTPGVDLIINASASHFSMGKHEQRRSLVVNRSREYACGYVYTNALGNEAGRILYDGGCMIASCGRMSAESSRFSFRDSVFVKAIIDIDAIRVAQATHANFNPLSNEVDAVHLRGTLETSMPFEPTTNTPNPLNEYDEFSAAIALALYDYVRKSHSTGVVISLSGGLDSTMCVIAAYLAYINAFNAGVDLWSQDAFITCVYQASGNSSTITLDAARAVAKDFGTRFFEYDIDAIVKGAVAQAENDLGVNLNWKDHDIPLQNVQPRARVHYPWLLANVLNAILLTTSNRSEAAVGYATMDGDTAGGLAPLAGVEKTFLRDWLKRFYETHKDKFPGLALVLAQQPTAELRPPGEAQTDEKDLMPYPVLQIVENLAVWQKKAPADVLETLCHDHGIERAQAAVWVRRFFTLFARNQWKRERYAPSFHLDDGNLDPNSWCRFPILNGGFNAELQELGGE